MVHQVQTLDVPAAIWLLYFEALARRCQGWCINAEVMRADLGDQPIVQDQRFYGIRFENRGTAAPVVILQAGDDTIGIANHFIHDPVAVREATSRPGDEADIQIESTDGTVTLLRFKRRLALPPGRVSLAGGIAQTVRSRRRGVDIASAASGAVLAVTAIAIAVYLLRRGRRATSYRKDGLRSLGWSAHRSKASRRPLARFTAWRA